MKGYNNVDQQLHLLCQILGKANRTYVPEKSDESHTNLYFDPCGNRILGRWIQNKTGGVLFALDLGSLSFDVYNASRKKILSAASIGKTMDEIEMELESLLPDLALDQWKYFRKLANQSCYDFLGYAQAESEVRIWPEHFDTGIYFEYAGRTGIGFGLAMKDSMVGEPYFYMAGYPKKESISYDKLPESSHWKWELGEHWKGVVLPLSEIEKSSNKQSETILSEYFMLSFDWYVKEK